MSVLNFLFGSDDRYFKGETRRKNKRAVREDGSATRFDKLLESVQDRVTAAGLSEGQTVEDRYGDILSNFTDSARSDGADTKRMLARSMATTPDSVGLGATAMLDVDRQTNQSIGNLYRDLSISNEGLNANDEGRTDNLLGQALGSSQRSQEFDSTLAFQAQNTLDTRKTQRNQAQTQMLFDIASLFGKTK